MKNLINKILAIFVLIIGVLVLRMIEMEKEGITIAAIAVYTKTCAKNVGGNSAVYLTEAANIATITVTAGEISALTMDTGKTFHEIQSDLDSIVHTQEGEGTRNNIAYTHRVEMKFSKPSVTLNTLRDELAAASACGILAIVTDGNGTSWLIGYNETDSYNRPLYLSNDSLNSGAEPNEDGSQLVTIALEGSSGYLSIPFDSTLGGNITGGTAPFITYV